MTTSNNEMTSGTSNRLVQVQDNSAAVKRQLTYRTSGDLYSDAISGGATYTYQYSARKRLVGVQTNGADAAWYGYDFRDQRVWRRLFSGGSSSEIHYIFDQAGHLLAEHNGYSGALLREYVWADDMPVAVIDKTSGTAVTYFIHNGHLNEPQMMTDAAKAKVWDAYVTPFGSAKVFTTATANVDIRLPGQWFQAEAAGSGLNQNHHRDYDPSLGRYIQVDPIGLNGGQNPYAYVDGMVYDYSDPTGRGPVGATVGGIIGGIGGAVFGLAAGGTVTVGTGGVGALAAPAIFWGSLASGAAAGAIAGSGLEDILASKPYEPPITQTRVRPWYPANDNNPEGTCPLSRVNEGDMCPVPGNKQCIYTCPAGEREKQIMGNFSCEPYIHPVDGFPYTPVRPVR